MSSLKLTSQSPPTGDNHSTSDSGSNRSFTIGTLERWDTIDRLNQDFNSSEEEFNMSARQDKSFLDTELFISEDDLSTVSNGVAGEVEVEGDFEKVEQFIDGQWVTVRVIHNGMSLKRQDHSQDIAEPAPQNTNADTVPQDEKIDLFIKEDADGARRPSPAPKSQCGQEEETKWKKNSKSRRFRKNKGRSSEPDDSEVPRHLPARHEKHDANNASHQEARMELFINEEEIHRNTPETRPEMSAKPKVKGTDSKSQWQENTKATLKTEKMVNQRTEMGKTLHEEVTEATATRAAGDEQQQQQLEETALPAIDNRQVCLIHGGGTKYTSTQKTY